MVNHAIILLGMIMIGVSTALFQGGLLSAPMWMILIGVGLYLGYVPFNSIFFDRMIATFQYVGTVGFIMYVADSFGYLGTVAVILSKTIFKLNLQWLEFYTSLVMIAAVTGVVGTLLSLIYFRRKYANHASHLK